MSEDPPDDEVTPEDDSEAGESDDILHIRTNEVVRSYIDAIQPVLDMEAMLAPVREMARQQNEILLRQLDIKGVVDNLIDPVLISHQKHVQALATNLLDAVQIPKIDLPDISGLLGFNPADLIVVPNLSHYLDLPTAARVEGFVSGVVQAMPTPAERPTQPQTSDPTFSLRTAMPVLAALVVVIYPIMLDTIQAQPNEVIQSITWSIALGLLVLMIKGPGQGNQ